MLGSFSRKSLSDFSARAMSAKVSFSSINTSIFLFSSERRFFISLKSTSIVMPLKHYWLPVLFNDYCEKPTAPNPESPEEP